MKKKLLFCETNRDGTIGGSFFSLLFLISGLDKQKYDVTVVFYKDNGLIPRYEQAGAEVHVFELPNSFNFQDIPFFSKLLNFPGNIFRIILKPVQKLINFNRFFISRTVKYWLFIKRNNFDLVHLNNTINWNHDWMLAAKLAGKKCITHERGINYQFRPFSKTFGKIIDGIICISNAVKNNLNKQGFNPTKLHLVYNGLDPSEIKVDKSTQEIYQELDLDPQHRIIGIVGNLKEWKGQETVVRAIALLKNKYPDLVCLLIGDVSVGDKPYMDRINNIIQSDQLEKNIILTGYKNNPANYVNILEFVIHASIDPEPFGRVLIEAMAMKKPVIGANGGAVPEIIKHDASGKLFTPGDEKDLARCIDDLLQDDGKIKRFGMTGYDILNKKFNIDINIKNTVNLYKSLI